jgi:hypothetical protein
MKDKSWLLVVACIICSLQKTVIAFAPSTTKQGLVLPQQSIITSLAAGQQPENESILDRFVSPTIDDPWLIMTEAGLAQIVAPSLQLFWLASLNAPFPSWATPILSDFMSAPRGSFLAPTLIHGAGLACCWLMGALAAKAYEQKSYEGNIGEVFLSTIKAGAFSCGLLILATQFDLYTDMGGYVQLGESVETDVRILRSTAELVNDCLFEAITLTTWRLYRSTVAF